MSLPSTMFPKRVLEVVSPRPLAQEGTAAPRARLQSKASLPSRIAVIGNYLPRHCGIATQALLLIASAQSIFPGAKHFACFDHAFHRTIPEVASHLPLPQCYYDAGIRRYGFHGLSYESLVHHFGNPLPERAIFAHLGNGSSLCALRHGVSIDTTMGITPPSGLPKGT